MTKYTCTVDGAYNEAGIKITVTDGTEISEFTVSDADTLNNLMNELKAFDNKYVDYNQLIQVLTNQYSDIKINATTLNGLASDKYAKISDLPSGESIPKDHSSSTTEYGVGNSSKYGHLKITNELTSKATDTALSASAGKSLNDLLSTTSTSAQNSSLRIYLGRNRTDNGEQNTIINVNKGEQIYARVSCDILNYDYTQLPILFIINNVPYDRPVNSDGKSDLFTINLDGSSSGKDYTITAFVRGKDGLNNEIVTKILRVWEY